MWEGKHLSLGCPPIRIEKLIEKSWETLGKHDSQHSEGYLCVLICTWLLE